MGNYIRMGTSDVLLYHTVGVIFWTDLLLIKGLNTFFYTLMEQTCKGDPKNIRVCTECVTHLEYAGY